MLSRPELSKIAAPSERRGTACDPTEASVSAPAFTGQPGRFSQPRICGSGLFDLFSKNIAKID
jgi:hypothetical protein